jgi:hypothetical protein
MDIPYHHTFRLILSSFLNIKQLREMALSRLILQRSDEKECIICKGKSISIIQFLQDSFQIEKFYCHDCEHIFSNNLRQDVQMGDKLFNYKAESNFLKKQLQLQVSLIKELKLSCGNILDFGVGGNLKIMENLSRRFPEFKFFACDIFQCKQKNYFQTYSEESPMHFFDGISSHAVIEHLDNTIEAWKYFNRLLKPLDNGGGIMLHSFPSQVNEDLFHWSIKIASHECLFSEKSLKLVCKMSGFKLIKCKLFTSAVHPVFVFRKVADV